MSIQRVKGDKDRVIGMEIAYVYHKECGKLSEVVTIIHQTMTELPFNKPWKWIDTDNYHPCLPEKDCYTFVQEKHINGGFEIEYYGLDVVYSKRIELTENEIVVSEKDIRIKD